MLYNIMFLKDVKNIYNIIPRGFKRKVVFLLIYNKLKKDGYNIEEIDDIEKAIDDLVLKEKKDYKTFTIEVLNRALCDEDIIKSSIKQAGIKKRSVIPQLKKLCKDHSEDNKEDNKIEKQPISTNKITVEDDIEAIEQLLYHKLSKKCNIDGNYLYIDFNIDKIDVILFKDNRVKTFTLSSNIYISTEKTNYYDIFKNIYYKFDDVNGDIDKNLSIDIKDFSDILYHMENYIKYIFNFIEYIDHGNIDKIFVNTPFYSKSDKIITLDNIDSEVHLINFFNSDFIHYYINLFGDSFKFIKAYYDMFEIYIVEDGKLKECKEFRDITVEKRFRESKYNLLIDFIENSKDSLRKEVIESI